MTVDESIRHVPVRSDIHTCNLVGANVIPPYQPELSVIAGWTSEPHGNGLMEMA